MVFWLAPIISILMENKLEKDVYAAGDRIRPLKSHW